MQCLVTNEIGRRFMLFNQEETDQEDDRHRTPLIIAIRRNHPNVVRALIAQEHGADVNRQSHVMLHHRTPLMEACYRGKLEIAKILLESNKIKNIDQKRPSSFTTQPGGLTALIDAVSSGYVPIVDLLLDFGADINQSSDDGKTPLVGENNND